MLSFSTFEKFAHTESKIEKLVWGNVVATTSLVRNRFPCLDIRYLMCMGTTYYCLASSCLVFNTTPCYLLRPMLVIGRVSSYIIIYIVARLHSLRVILVCTPDPMPLCMGNDKTTKKKLISLILCNLNVHGYAFFFIKAIIAYH
jgi:hypothetical protein